MKNIFVSMAMVGLLASPAIVAPPDTLDEAKGIGEQIFSAVPGIIKEVWNSEVMPILNQMFALAKNFWDENIWWRIEPEVEKRKALIPQELEKEKGELSQELQTELESQGGFQGLWERFKVLIPELLP